MSSFSADFRRFKYKLRHDYLTIENVALFIAIIFCFYCTYRSIEKMSRNWELSERLNTAKKTLELRKIEIETAELENAYFESDEYQELAARRFANKQFEGEKMVYLPENSEAAKNKHENEVATTAAAEKKEYSNFEQWMMYLWP